MKKNLCESVKNRGFIEEREIIILKSRLNSGGCSIPEYHEIFAGGEIAISADQAKKGFSWLVKQWKTPAGKERKNNPFGYREQNILQNFDRFALVDFCDVSRCPGFRNYLPVYRVYDKSGNSFEYYNNFEGLTLCG